MYCLLDLRSSECDVVSLYVVCFSVNVCLFCVFDSVCELFAMRLGVVAILLLNVMEVWVEVLCWIDHVWSSKECVCCACDTSVHISVPSICLCFCMSVHLSVPSICLCFCMSEVLSSFKSLRAG